MFISAFFVYSDLSGTGSSFVHACDRCAGTSFSFGAAGSRARVHFKGGKKVSQSFSIHGVSLCSTYTVPFSECLRACFTTITTLLVYLVFAFTGTIFK